MTLALKKPTKKSAKEPVAAKGISGGASAKVLEALKKQHGEFIGDSGATYAPVGRLATGIYPLDLAVGGGLPLNKATILVGPPSSGKTSVGLRVLAACQYALKKRAVLIDREDVYDRSWTKKHGVDVEKLIVIKAANAEQCVDAVEGFLNADDVGAVVLDSLAAAQPQKWIEAEAGKAPVGGNTQILSSLYTKAGVALTRRGWDKNDTLFVAINQIRYKVGVMYGDPETMPGGMGPQHWSSLTLRFYGKKEADKAHSEHMPATLHVSAVVKKWRIPILANSFEYDMALVPQGSAKVGDVVDTWKTVGSHLQNFGLLLKEGKEWTCLGVHESTLEQMKERYVVDKAFQFECQKAVIDYMRKNAEIDAQT